jgi:leader peptidase (prepilin peptidase)/N-methyltransferase
MTLPVPFWILAGAAGLGLGSYTATAALRGSKGRQSTLGRSSCDHCGIQLGFAATTPVISFIRLRGVCSACGGAIDPVHLVGELIGALIVVSALATADLPRALALIALGFVLLFDALVDWRIGRLPDLAALAIAILGLCLALMRSTSVALLSIACAAATFGLLEIIRQTFLKVRRRPGLGFGDVKLLAALAIWTGLLVPWVVVLAALTGLMALRFCRPIEGRLPFGPSIAAAAWTVGLANEAGVLRSWA